MPRSAFRDAERTDIDALSALEAAVFASDRLSRRSFARLIDASSAACRIASVGGRPAGYALTLFRDGSTVARLYSIAVAPAFRGRGLAAALIADAERLARRRGSRALRLEVRTDNRAAIRLYDKLGFRPIGRRAGYYADGTDALRYEKPLAPAGRAAEDRSPRDSRRRPTSLTAAPGRPIGKAPAANAAHADAAVP